MFDIAGARFVSQSDVTIVHEYPLACPHKPLCLCCQSSTNGGVEQKDPETAGDGQAQWCWGANLQCRRSKPLP
jgi:hypothetical protein